MDNSCKSHEKLPAAMSDFSIGNNTQTNICGYLVDLQDRLKQTVEQHSKLIYLSVNLIKELSEASTMLTLNPSIEDLQATKIKRLIMEFESMHAGDNDQGLSSSEVTNLRDIIADYRRLDESHLLQDSLMCCKLANESLGKVQSLMNQLKANGWETTTTSPQSSQILEGNPSTNQSLREKIRAFNQASKQGENPLQNFPLCFSSKSSDPMKSQTNYDESDQLVES